MMIINQVIQFNEYYVFKLKSKKSCYCYLIGIKIYGKVK